MNRIAGRAWALLLIVGVLLGGLGFFLYEYAAEAGDWVLHSGNPHVYEDAQQQLQLTNGTVVDRDGQFLMDLSGR